jgi:hypothetical protein
MESSKETNTSLPTALFHLLSPDLLLGLATGSVLIGVLTARKAGQAIQAVGQLSEEVFRGDRLPPLDFPQTEHPQSADNP